MDRSKVRPDLYGTRQVAAILGIPEWRVKNFSEGEAYRLPPSVQLGRGRGTRRSYGWADIFRIGLADRLVEVGFSPESVGKAVHKIPQATFDSYAALLHPNRVAFMPKKGEQLRLKEIEVLINEGGAWRLVSANDAEREWRKAIDRGGSDLGRYLISITNVCFAILERLTRYWTGELQETRG